MNSSSHLKPSRYEALKWFASKVEWIEKSNRPAFGLGPAYMVCMEDRLGHARRFIEENGIENQVSIIKAFTPDSLNLPELVERGIISSGFIQGRHRETRIREICCSLGHLAATLDSQLAGFDIHVHLEDDNEIHDDRDDIDSLIRCAASFEWQLFYFSYSHADMQRSQRLAEGVYRIVGQLCTNAYAVRSHARDAMLDSWTPINNAVDRYLRDFAQREDLFVLGAARRVLNQDRSVFGSAIGANREFPPPQWSPLFLQKLLARLISITKFGDPRRYGEVISLVDRYRSTGPTTINNSDVALRIWSKISRHRSPPST